MTLTARQLYFEAVKVGDELPPLVKPPVDRLQIARYVGAAQDWNPLSIDEPHARSAGFPSAFAPGMIGMGFLGELVSDWVRGARLRKFQARFVKIVWPGDVLTVRGRVTDRRFEPNGAYGIDIEAWAENQRGELVTRGLATFQMYYSAEDEARQRAGQAPLLVTAQEEEARLARLSRAQPPRPVVAPRPLQPPRPIAPPPPPPPPSMAQRPAAPPPPARPAPRRSARRRRPARRRPRPPRPPGQGGAEAGPQAGPQAGRQARRPGRPEEAGAHGRREEAGAEEARAEAGRQEGGAPRGRQEGRREEEVAVKDAVGATLLAAALLACARPATVDAAPRGAQADPAAAPLAEGIAAWAERGQPARLAAALDAFRRAARVRPGDAALELHLARAEAFRALAAGATSAGGARSAGGAGAEARAAHEASARAAERALAALAPAFAEALSAGRSPAEAVALVPAAGAEPLYWLALGHMGVAQASGHAAVLAVKDQVLPLMARAAELDEAVDEGGPLRALGAWSAMLPVAAGGGVAPARARFARAAERFPGEPWRRVLEARTLAVLLQDRPAFERLLGEVLAAGPDQPGARAPEAALARREAQALLDKRASLF